MALCPKELLLRIYRFILSAATALLAILALSSEAASSRYLKGVTYFGAASPVTFWNSDLSRVAADFKEIRADGFNTVILVVPWGEFQPGLQPGRINADAFARLARVCRAASAEQLQVQMRLSYLHDHYPGEDLAGDKRAVMLLSNDRLMPDWLSYLQRIQTATRGCASGSFLSWEDFWIVFKHLDDAEAGHLPGKIAKDYGYDAWINRHANQAYRGRYAAIRKQLGYYPFPKRRSPDFAWVFRWFDDQLSNRLMSRASQVLRPLSLEPRVDDDPIFDGERRIDWFSHKASYQVRSSPYVMSYWAPAMGAQNHGELEEADKVLERFAYMQKKMATDTSNRIFLEQFLFKDNSLLATQNARIKPEQLSDFLQRAALPLLSLSSGYALWGARDYDASMLFNGFFSLGKKGWQFKGGATLAQKGPASAMLPQGASITQNVREALTLRAMTKLATLRMRLTGPGTIKARYADQERSAEIGAGESWVKLSFPVANVDTDLVISSSAGDLRLAEVHLYDFTQIGDVRGTLGQPGLHLADIQELNRKLDTGGGIPSRIAAGEGDSLRLVAGVHGVERDGQSSFAWVGPRLRAMVLAKGKTIVVSGHIKPEMFKTKRGCQIRAALDGRLASVQEYRISGPVLLNVPVPEKTQGLPVELTLDSNCSLNPKQAGKGNDDRNLSFILNEINALP